MTDEAAAAKAIGTSLTNLGLEYIDLYLLHQAMGDYFAAYRAMESAYKAGKLKAIGVANFFPNILCNFCETVEVTPAVNQVELNPFFTQEDALANMKNYGVQPMAWELIGEVLVDGVMNPGDVKNTDGLIRAAAIADKI